MSYRPDWWDDGGRSVCEIACDVMATIRGSYDRSDASQDFDIRMIKHAARHWQESTDTFDLRVRDLLETCLYYVNINELRRGQPASTDNE